MTSTKRNVGGGGGGGQCKIFLIKHHMAHNRTLDLLPLPLNGSDWGMEWYGATLNCVDNVGSVGGK